MSTCCLGDKLCNKYTFLEGRVDFTDNEKMFICGSETKGWRQIPKTQSESFIQTFLKNRGYYQSKIENNVILTRQKSHISRVNFVNAPKAFFNLKYDDSVGKTLTEDNLKLIEDWTLQRLEATGHPCASVQISASYLSGIVKVKIDPKKKIHISKIQKEDTQELDTRSYQRHYAIKIDDLYNGDFLTLTSRRMMRSNLASYSYFTHSCDNPGVLNQKVIINKPNIVIFGVGASTEELPIFKSSWKNSRIDSMGSSFEVLLYMSSIEKSLELSHQYYLVKSVPSFSARTFVRYENIDERIFKTESQIAGIDFSYNKDIKNYSATASLIPRATNENQLEGEAPGESQFVSVEAKLKVLSHYYEFFQGSPRRGEELAVSVTNYNGSNNEDNKAAGNLLHIQGIKLFNVTKFDPPKYVFGVRFSYDHLFSSTQDQTPQKYRIYLGGEDNIRGFARKSINNNEFGFMRALHFALESRFNDLLPYGIQPLVFFDMAKVATSKTFTDDILYSPGLGLRWQSPFGSFRATLAKGIIYDKTQALRGTKERFNLFLSFGKEF